MTEKKERRTFEDDLRELEELVKRLEEGRLDLDESLKVYENAIMLRDRCRRFLDESERRVQKLMETSEGVVKEDLGPR